MKVTFKAKTPVVGSQLFLLLVRENKNNCPWIISLCPRRAGDRDLASVGVERKGARLPIDLCRPRTPGQWGPVDHAVKTRPCGGRRAWDGDRRVYGHAVRIRRHCDGIGLIQPLHAIQAVGLVGRDEALGQEGEQRIGHRRVGRRCLSRERLI